jgi:hypothetical protein
MSAKAAVERGFIEFFAVRKAIVHPRRMAYAGNVIIKDRAFTWNADTRIADQAIKLASGFSVVAVHFVKDGGTISGC